MKNFKNIKRMTSLILSISIMTSALSPSLVQAGLWDNVKSFGSAIVINTILAGKKVKNTVKNVTKDVFNGCCKIANNAKDCVKKVVNSDVAKKSKKLLRKVSPIIPILIAIPLTKYLFKKVIKPKDIPLSLKAKVFGWMKRNSKKLFGGALIGAGSGILFLLWKLFLKRNDELLGSKPPAPTQDELKEDKENKRNDGLLDDTPPAPTEGEWQEYKALRQAQDDRRKNEELEEKRKRLEQDIIPDAPDGFPDGWESEKKEDKEIVPVAPDGFPDGWESEKALRQAQDERNKRVVLWQQEENDILSSLKDKVVVDPGLIKWTTRQKIDLPSTIYVPNNKDKKESEKKEEQEIVPVAPDGFPDGWESEKKKVSKKKKRQKPLVPQKTYKKKKNNVVIPKEVKKKDGYKFIDYSRPNDTSSFEDRIKNGYSLLLFANDSCQAFKNLSSNYDSIRFIKVSLIKENQKIVDEYMTIPRDYVLVLLKGKKTVTSTWGQRSEKDLEKFINDNIKIKPNKRKKNEKISMGDHHHLKNRLEERRKKCSGNNDVGKSTAYDPTKEIFSNKEEEENKSFEKGIRFTKKDVQNIQKKQKLFESQDKKMTDTNVWQSECKDKESKKEEKNKV
ncbi:hypothetical protein ACFLYU_05195 [Candidatus Dependentiae bacterium]